MNTNQQLSGAAGIAIAFSIMTATSAALVSGGAAIQPAMAQGAQQSHLVAFGMVVLGLLGVDDAEDEVDGESDGSGSLGDHRADPNLAGFAGGSNFRESVAIMSKTTNEFPPEVRNLAIRMMLDHKAEHPSR
ncbi:hypothetical protein C8J31_11455 [Rhizobium sp. PP-CC-2G-626]|nr:hypothetical protein C8J31_11455 [Rhizobium sp. PP-CC-2G-626]